MTATAAAPLHDPNDTALIRTLGHAGLIPFVLLAALLWLVNVELQAWVAIALAAYAALIASFLGGIHWGIGWQAGRHAAVNTVSLELTIANDAGVLGRICTLIGEQKANISDLHFVDRKPDFYKLVIDVELRDLEHLHMVMTALEAETDVAQISRHRDLTRRP